MKGRGNKRGGPLRPQNPKPKPRGGGAPGPHETRGGGGPGPQDQSTIDLKSLRQSMRDPNHKFKGQRFDRYDLLSEISRGAMGVVLRAKHVKLGSLVALKLLSSQDPTPEATARFTREGQVLAHLKHPNVVGISDLGESKGIHFLAMELIEGPDLYTLVSQKSAKNEVFSIKRSVEVALAMAKALAYCHDAGAIHRDIKPQNILIEHNTDRPVLTDFGLVKRDASKMQSGQSAAISQAGKILGTPSFMAPEQFEPDGQYGKVGEKSDVYGLGATLFYMLTGTPPFKAANVVNLYTMVLNDPAPRVSNVRAGVPDALDEILEACLTKHADQRISMQDLVKKLEALASDAKLLEPVKASSGLRHALFVILFIAILGVVDLTMIHKKRGVAVMGKIKQMLGMKADEPGPEDAGGSGDGGG